MTIPWLDQFVADCHTRLLALDARHAARQLLHTRGVDLPAIERHRLGWLPDPHGITHCTPEFWDWVRRYGWDKLVFPLTTPFGGTMGLQLRSPHQRGYRDFLAVKSELCPPLFGMSTALPVAFTSRRLVVVEGVFDYFAVARYAPETLAMLTSAASLSVRRLLARYATVVVCLTDMDAPGRRGAYRLAGLPIPPQFARPKDLTAGIPKPPPYRVVFPFYSEHDPSDLWTAGKHAELERLARTGVLAVGA